MKETTDLQQELEAARAAVRVAGAAVMRYFRDLDTVDYKGPEQPVTAADLAADRLLRQRFAADFPADGWLSEETTDSPERLERSRVWIVDPIDGTNSFVEGRPEFTLCVGLAVGGEVVLGVVYNPATDELYHALRGGGAFLNDRPIHVAASLGTSERGVMLVSRSELRRGELEPYASQWNLIPLGSTAYRMVKVADGTGHVFVSRGGKQEWDVCAATLIVREAGGEVRQIDGRDLVFNQPEPVFRGVVVTNGTEFVPQDAPPSNRG